MNKVLQNTRTLGFELSTLCNFNCWHCYQVRDYSLFSLQNIQILIDMAFRNDIFHIFMTGGEPFLHPNFCDLYVALRKNGFLISIFTNASVLPPGVKQILAKHPPHLIEVSLYGFSEQSYLKTTRNTAFQQVMDHIAFFRSNKFNLTVKYIVLTSTYADIPIFKNFSEIHKINTMYAAQVIPRLNGDLRKR